MLATSLLTAPILYFCLIFFSVYFCTLIDVIITSLSCHMQADLQFLSFFLNNTETESYEKQVVVELCLFCETQPETESISQFDSWECKSAGNFRKHWKYMCKLRNFPVNGNVNQLENSAISDSSETL